MLQSLLERTARSLEKRGLPFMIIGGQAAFAHGEPRASKDIGIALGFGPESVKAVCEVMREVGLTSLADSPEQYVAETYVLPCLHEKAGIRVGFIFTLTGYEARAIQRAIPRKVGKTLIPFASPEDLIIEKVFSGGQQDLDDAQGMLLRHKGLDLEYIREILLDLEQALGLTLLARFDAIAAAHEDSDTRK